MSKIRVWYWPYFHFSEVKIMIGWHLPIQIPSVTSNLIHSIVSSWLYIVADILFVPINLDEVQEYKHDKRLWKRVGSGILNNIRYEMVKIFKYSKICTYKVQIEIEFVFELRNIQRAWTRSNKRANIWHFLFEIHSQFLMDFFYINNTAAIREWHIFLLFDGCF